MISLLIRWSKGIYWRRWDSRHSLGWQVFAAVLIFKSRNHVAFPYLRLRLIVFGSTQCVSWKCAINLANQSIKALKKKILLEEAFGCGQSGVVGGVEGYEGQFKVCSFSYSLTCFYYSNSTTLFLLHSFLYPTEAAKRQEQCHLQSHQQSHQPFQDVRGTSGNEAGD